MVVTDENDGDRAAGDRWRQSALMRGALAERLRIAVRVVAQLRLTFANAQRPVGGPFRVNDGGMVFVSNDQCVAVSVSSENSTTGLSASVLEPETLFTFIVWSRYASDRHDEVVNLVEQALVAVEKSVVDEGGFFARPADYAGAARAADRADDAGELMQRLVVEGSPPGWFLRM